MTEHGSKRMMIALDTGTGNVVKVEDENRNEATRVDSKELEGIYQSKNGFKYVGSILHVHSSPGCLYFVLGGWGWKICF
jgi:hypothetical protein